MVRKIICILFAACILYSVPAYAVSKDQLENRLKPYIQNTVHAALQEECAEYNVQPPSEIDVRVARLDNHRCGIFLIISGPGDPRVIAVAADMVAVESVNILNKLGMSDKAMQKARFRVSVMPITQNRNGKWSAYDASICFWEGTKPKLEWLDADTVYNALGLDK